MDPTPLIRPILLCNAHESVDLGRIDDDWRCTEEARYIVQYGEPYLNRAQLLAIATVCDEHIGGAIGTMIGSDATLKVKLVQA